MEGIKIKLFLKLLAILLLISSVNGRGAGGLEDQILEKKIRPRRGIGGTVAQLFLDLRPAGELTARSYRSTSSSYTPTTAAPYQSNSRLGANYYRQNYYQSPSKSYSYRPSVSYTPKNYYESYQPKNNYPYQSQSPAPAAVSYYQPRSSKYSYPTTSTSTSRDPERQYNFKKSQVYSKWDDRSDDLMESDYQRPTRKVTDHHHPDYLDEPSASAAPFRYRQSPPVPKSSSGSTDDSQNSESVLSALIHRPSSSPVATPVKSSFGSSYMNNFVKGHEHFKENFMRGHEHFKDSFVRSHEHLKYNFVKGHEYLRNDFVRGHEQLKAQVESYWKAFMPMSVPHTTTSGGVVGEIPYHRDYNYNQYPEYANQHYY